MVMAQGNTCTYILSELTNKYNSDDSISSFKRFKIISLIKFSNSTRICNEMGIVIRRVQHKCDYKDTYRTLKVFCTTNST